MHTRVFVVALHVHEFLGSTIFCLPQGSHTHLRFANSETSKTITVSGDDERACSTSTTQVSFHITNYFELK
jgi:hypothetical protein